MTSDAPISRDDRFEIGAVFRLQYEPVQQACVLLYPEGMVKLAPSAIEILRRCDGSLTVGELIAQLKALFQGADLDDDVLAFLTHARGTRWIQPSEGPNPAANRRILLESNAPQPVDMPAGITRPHWLLAELTYRCPLQCPYCSNPVDMARYREELTTEQWKRILYDARAMGAVQLGFSGGEPLVRKDLEELISYGRELGYYSNLITSGVGMDEARVRAFREAGLDHIQISFQASDETLNNYIAGTDSFEHKLAMARAVKAQGYPMVLNIVIHRQNIEQIEAILDMAVELQADFVELASTQYYGWSRVNAEHLLPTRAQLQRAEAVAHQYQDRYRDRMKIIYVVPDYFEDRPKACMNGWGSVFLTVVPDGRALPCHAAGQLPGMTFPHLAETSVYDAWCASDAFNAFRGLDWMAEPCRSCPEKEKDFGGCRCQAYMLTGDARNADPVCAKSPHKSALLDEVNAIEARAEAGEAPAKPLIFRNMRNSRELAPTE
ncbi:MAG: pyrroloquinoline quinone biosynthesis protein PqqE [Pseudomonadota bacterium]